jgi:hypothetical protein
MSETTSVEGVLAAHQRRQVARIKESDQSLWIACQGCDYLGPLERPWAAHQADELRKAGLVGVTTTEWGVRHSQGFIHEEHGRPFTEAQARDRFNEFEAGDNRRRIETRGKNRLMRRQVTEWRPA